MMKRNLLVLCMVLLTVPTFAQKFSPTKTETQLILIVRDYAKLNLKKVDLYLTSTSDPQKKYHTTTDKKGIAQILVSAGHSYRITVEDSTDWDLVEIPNKPYQTTRHIVYYEGNINGKLHYSGKPLYLFKPTHGKANIRMTFVDYNRKPLPNEAVELVGTNPANKYAGTTNAAGKLQFEVEPNEIYKVRLKHNQNFDKIKIPKYGGNVDVTYGYMGTEAIEKAMQEMANLEDTTVASKPNSRFSKGALKTFAELAEETHAALYLKGSEDNATEMVELVLGEQLRPNSDLVLLIDQSGSMMNDISELINNLHKLSEILSAKKDVRVSIAVYGNNCGTGEDDGYQASPFTSNFTRLGKMLDELNPGDASIEPAYDGIWRSVKELDWRNGAHKMILLLGDEPPEPKGECSEAGKEDVLALLKDEPFSCNIFPILFSW